MLECDASGFKDGFDFFYFSYLWEAENNADAGLDWRDGNSRTNRY